MTRNRPDLRAGLLICLGVSAALCGLASRVAGADPRPARDYARAPAPHQHLDARFSHNHAYYDRGFVVHDLPRDRIVVNHGGGRYYYSGGVWYAPRGPWFVVVAPPIGVFVPVLPPFYSTVWFGGVPYYYANDTYYVWSAPDNAYEVVDPPAGAVNAAPDAAPPPPPTTNRLFIYPRNGQSAEQQAKDKYECHAWALNQTGFDPTAAGGNVPPDQFAARSTQYYRAMASCLQGRGYSVE
ncbi:MAG TPA: DUF6515 family protein [Steroidobacteraceae bacterium]|nr:DUF6515 family protein [Steroidobacteraceae bacterium]